MPDDVIGVEEVKKLFEEVGKAPARVMTKATKAGAKVVLNAAKTIASQFEDPTGALKSGIVMKAEKAQKGKRVYQIFVNSDPRFVKISKEGKRSFYPASQEYGWTDQYGHYHPGYRFMRRAAEENAGAVNGLILQVLGEELDKLR